MAPLSRSAVRRKPVLCLHHIDSMSSLASAPSPAFSPEEKPEEASKPLHRSPTFQYGLATFFSGNGRISDPKASSIDGDAPDDQASSDASGSSNHDDAEGGDDKSIDGHSDFSSEGSEDVPLPAAFRGLGIRRVSVSYGLSGQFKWKSEQEERQQEEAQIARFQEVLQQQASSIHSDCYAKHQHLLSWIHHSARPGSPAPRSPAPPRP